jgi:hypothetical protein
LFHGDFAIGDGSGNKEGARFNSVRQDRVLAAIQFGDPLNFEVMAADSMNLRAHLHEHVAQIDHFRLAGGALDTGCARCEDGGHDHVRGASDRRSVASSKIQVVAPEAGSIDMDVSVADIDLATESLEALQVEIDRARPDHATAGEGDFRLPQTTDQRPQQADGGPHLANQLVGGPVVHVGRFYFPGVGSCLLHAGTEVAEDFRHEANVGEVGNPVDTAGLARQQRCGENGQSRILGAAGGNRSPKRATSFDAE